MNDLILTLLVFVSQQTGYHIPPDIQPQVIYASHSYFVSHFCDGIDTVMVPCDTVGMYLVQKNEIYIDITKLDGDRKNSFLVHELTHFLQHANHAHLGTSCAEARIREDEAYKVQNIYGLAHGVVYNPPASDEDIICDHTQNPAITRMPYYDNGDGPWLRSNKVIRYAQGEGPWIDNEVEN